MTATHAPATPLVTIGSLITTTGTSLDLDWWRGPEYAEGIQVILDEHVPADEASEGHAYYWASDDGGAYTVAIAAEHVRELKTPEQVAHSQLPTPEDLRASAAEALRSNGAFTSSVLGAAGEDGTIMLRGRTEDGRPFGVNVIVGRPFEIAV